LNPKEIINETTEFIPENELKFDEYLEGEL